MYRTGTVSGGWLTLLVDAWLASVQWESSKPGCASGASLWKRQWVRPGSGGTGGGPRSEPASAPPGCAVVGIGERFQVTRLIGGAARIRSGVGSGAPASGADQADVSVAPPSWPACGNEAAVSP